ncbi:GGDEF domain-containing protein [Colwellia ponticola]|uniref:diguanylate cyclase n=1 Tax=Colwellia ponticola TaxID=2304625 RepID=A0A8H2JKP7_9GAMM|nr:GGDEF domain-containing protein [Colwellia ponticola]TMM43966.1 GGDEF domain-containing protein [Colwellia ponticola]
MKKNSTIFDYFTQYSLIVLLLIPISLTFKTAQAFQIQQQNVTKGTLSIEEISKKLTLADKYRRSNPTLFKEIIFEIAQQKNLPTELQQYLNLLYAYHLTFVGEYDVAEDKLKAVLHSNASSLLKFRANYALINIYMPAKNWQKGLEQVTKNINALPTIHNNEHYQNGLLITIIFYNQMGQYSLALNYIDLLAKRNLSDKNDCWLRQLTLEAKFNLHKLTSNAAELEDTIQKCTSANNKINANIVRIYKTKLFLQEDMPNKALSFILSYLEQIRLTQYPMLIAETVNVIAKAYWQLGDVDNTKVYTTEALAVNKNMTNLLQGVDTYFLLYQVAKKQQDFPLALRYFEKYAKIEKAHLEGEKAKHLAFQLAEHKSFEQKAKIELLNKENALLISEQALAKAKVTNVQLMMAILAVILVLFILWFGRLLKAHKRIKELAEYDALTGIYNRGHFTHVAQSALEHCKSTIQPLSLIMFDLDHFKKVNDTFGHACGDWALKATINACKHISRKNDIFARLGGEEFCLLLPSCNIDVAILRAEACRAAIEAITTAESGYEFSITASFGVTDVVRSGYNLEKLLADADSAAYVSKNSGRNRVTTFDVSQINESKN